MIRISNYLFLLFLIISTSCENKNSVSNESNSKENTDAYPETIFGLRLGMSYDSQIETLEKKQTFTLDPITGQYYFKVELASNEGEILGFPTFKYFFNEQGEKILTSVHVQYAISDFIFETNIGRTRYFCGTTWVPSTTANQLRQIFETKYGKGNHFDVINAEIDCLEKKQPILTYPTEFRKDKLVVTMLISQFEMSEKMQEKYQNNMYYSVFVSYVFDQKDLEKMNLNAKNPTY